MKNSEKSNDLFIQTQEIIGVLKENKFYNEASRMQVCLDWNKTKSGSRFLCQLRYCPICNQKKAKSYRSKIIRKLKANNLHLEDYTIFFCRLTPNQDQSIQDQFSSIKNRVQILSSPIFLNSISR